MILHHKNTAIDFKTTSQATYLNAFVVLKLYTRVYPFLGITPSLNSR